MKVAVVTPYYREPPATLRRCIESVRAQTHAQVQHYLVADGHPQPEVTQDYAGLSCVNLPQSHADFGDTPRAVGAMCALNEGADILCFLDADNMFEPDHVASAVAVYQKASAAGQPLDAVFAFRHVFLPGHEHLRLKDSEELRHAHVDTSCFTLARSAAFLWPAWGLIPKGLGSVCDRVMLALMRQHGLRVAWTGRHTVLYESNWSAHYRLAGVPLPATGLHDHTMRNVARDFSEEELFAHLRTKLRLRPARI